jgi:CRP-like cAMP-binding protein
MTLPMTIDELRALPPFAGLTEEGIARLQSCAGELEAPAGQVLTIPGDPGAGMFVVVDGSVLVEYRGGHRSLGPGEVFGELALFSEKATRVGRVRAESDTKVLAVPAAETIALVETEPSLGLALLRTVASRFAGVLAPDQ